MTVTNGDDPLPPRGSREDPESKPDPSFWAIGAGVSVAAMIALDATTGFVLLSSAVYGWLLESGNLSSPNERDPD
jgi:hypothetical protein